MTATNIIDGKAFAEGLRKDIAGHVARLKAEHRLVPGLSVVLVGDDPASHVYVRNKGKATLEAGMKSEEFRLPASATQAEVLARVEALNNDPTVHGILVQLPLPKQVDSAAIINAIDPDKDVDGFHVVNVGRLNTGQPSMVPCTPLGCLLMLKHHLGNLAGKRAVVVGRSNIVGKPMAALLLGESCTVTIAHSRTADLPGEVRRADIVIAAVGKAEMVRGDWIKPGATVIDVGINRIERDGKAKLVGDVAFDEAVKVAGLITPVPGGVGPMTIACLLRNTVTAACRIKGIPDPQ
ncbi:MAG: bifunctional methylenetetrahydrofolate dehydrogenase/methenyltetrahydrofolate cyclohydrolase FolD [Alphaproteobacteria bacterium]|nr:bifunctional methylenetetrahydrofolate dehydrogenase/methenyltetrahydrofolate cyclohydrolase FolD [Alphaproteobacteria bacterium]